MKLQLQISRGYRAREITEEMPIEQAFARLTSFAHHRYGTALRMGDRAILTRHVIHCPYCGYEEPAYSDKCKPSTESLVAWADMQQSLFDVHNLRTLRKPLYPEAHLCSRCEKTALRSDEILQLTLESTDEVITLSCPVEGIAQLLENTWLTDVQLFGGFPLQQQLRFDLGSGTTELLLKDRKDTVLCRRPVYPTEINEDSSLLFRLIADHLPVRRALRRLFLEFWEVEFPFSTKELTMEAFLLMTCFTGFPHSFYEAVPLSIDTRLPEASFRETVPLLKHYQMAPALLQRSSLPQLRSVRRCFGQDPGLLFYLDECEALWELLQDPNLLCRLLKSPPVYLQLSQLHTYPGLLQFYRDFCRLQGRHALLRMLTGHLQDFHSLALTYCAMGPIHRQMVLEKGKKALPQQADPWGGPPLPRLPKALFSTPFQRPPENIPDRQVHSFRFRWLRTRLDYTDAGTQMDNCLITWSSEQPPVAVATRGGKYCAALEVHNGAIRQALGPDNDPLEKDSPIALAVLEWARLHNLRTNLIPHL